MSYTVLAVKWRPRRFEDLVGQEHVVRALVNSLAGEKLHHAYLFTGTRGVGKTTVARILAKALNCEQGVVPEPCGVCDACTAIDQGRFVDLIEVDAASRTKVDDTRELLDNVQYAPSRGRYKVYLIDEVHMLSNHSFNALLKTLEEPPPHVKFLLATTDPQKLPVTVLSRCLQFNMKRLTVPQIQGQLEKVCDAEGVPAEADGLKALAKAADGSMRDALSMLDQGIAFCGGEIKAEPINAMLGTIDRGHVLRILEALADEDGAALLDVVEQLAERVADFATVLDELMGALQQLAVIQLVGDRVSEEDLDALKPLAERICAEDVQLYYQIAVQGRRDLPIGRDPRVGFEMTLLRMLAFRPAASEAPPDAGGSTGGGQHGGPGPSRPRAPGGASQAPAAAAGESGGRPRGAAAVRARLEEQLKESGPGRARSSAARETSAGRQSRDVAAVSASAGDDASGARGARHSAGGRGSTAAASTPVATASTAAAQTAPAQAAPAQAAPAQAAPAQPAAAQTAAAQANAAPAAWDDEPWAEPPDLDFADAPPAPPPGPDFAYEDEARPAAAADSEWKGSWASLIEAADVRGAARQLADHCELAKATGRRFELIVAEGKATLATQQVCSRLENAIGQHLGRRVTLSIMPGKPPRPTPAEIRLATENERMRKAREAMEQDPNVKAAQEAFGAVLEADTIRPMGEAGEAD